LNLDLAIEEEAQRRREVWNEHDTQQLNAAAAENGAENDTGVELVCACITPSMGRTGI
jgi:hypothetical protein